MTFYIAVISREKSSKFLILYGGTNRMVRKILRAKHSTAHGHLWLKPLSRMEKLTRFCLFRKNHRVLVPGDPHGQAQEKDRIHDHHSLSPAPAGGKHNPIFLP